MNSAFPLTAVPPSIALPNWRLPWGIDALRDAGIPLVMRYKTTSKGSQLPGSVGPPDALRDDTGVIFASAFPGCDSFADEMSRYYNDHSRREQLGMLESLLARARRSRTAIPSSNTKLSAARKTCETPSKKSPMFSTGASCSECWPWAIRSSPNSSAPAVRTRKSTRPAPAPRKPWRWRKTGSTPVAAAA